MTSEDARLADARAHQAGGRMVQALAAYRSLAAEPALETALAGLRPLVALLMRSLQITEAQHELAQFLRRQFILPGSPPGPQTRPQPRVLLTYGLQSWESIVFPKFGEALPFVINAGHFDIAALLRSQNLAIDRAFVPADLAAAAADECRLRIGAYRAVVNVVADPIAESEPLAALASLLQGYAGRVINPPAQVAATTREQVAARLADCPGIVAPRCSRIHALDAGQLQAALAASPGGLIVRPLNSQTGTGVRRISTPADIAAVASELAGQCAYVTDYHEFGDLHGQYAKLRFFLVGGELFPEHRIVADRWNIHSAERDRLMRGQPDLQAAERRFLDDPAAVIGADAIRMLQGALAQFRLDYIGCDLAQLPDGRLLVFEANPAMRVNYDHSAEFPYLRPHLDRIAQAFTKLVEQAAGG